MKKVIIVVLCSLFLFMLTPNLSKANSTSYFTDISNSYAIDAILELTEAGILNGTGEGTFNPTANISRQDFAIIMAKALGLDTTTPPSTQTFSDVQASHYSYRYVEAAVKAGLLSGIGNGQFGIDSQLTKEQMAVVFVNALGVDSSGMGNSLTFSDSDSISSWAKDAVAYAAVAGLITGTPAGSFDPLAPAERQQVALVASKFIDVIEENNPEPEPNPNIPAPQPDPEPNPNPTPQPEPEPNPIPPIDSAPQPEPNPPYNPGPNPNPNPNPTPNPNPNPTSPNS